MPQPKKHEEKEWYHRQCSRAQAEELLRKTGTEVAFLVRPSEKDAGSYAISFRYATVMFCIMVRYHHNYEPFMAHCWG